MRRPFKEYRPFGPVVDDIDFGQMVKPKDPVMEELELEESDKFMTIDRSNPPDKYKKKIDMAIRESEVEV
jgi:hypothetical protein